MANNLHGSPQTTVSKHGYLMGALIIAPAHGHSFAAEYRQQMVSKEPWPGQVQTDSIMVSTPPTLLNAVKALALQGRKDNARILVAKCKEEQGKKKNPFCIDCSCHGTQACVAAEGGAAPGAQRAISSRCQTPGANLASCTAQPAVPAIALGPAQSTETWPHHRSEPWKQKRFRTGFSWYKASDKEDI
ncbi:hypothetical protein TURU_130580 [Turdus rufiventris]|nr:hypothetical protein TURU_130580 [Turdus rufiventris]